LRRYRLLQDVSEGKKKWRVDEGKGVSSYCRTLSKRENTETKAGSTRSPSVENSLSKRLRTCRKTDHVMVMNYCVTFLNCLPRCCMQERSYPQRAVINIAPFFLLHA
jgi:hypothetical protein